MNAALTWKSYQASLPFELYVWMYIAWPNWQTRLLHRISMRSAPQMELCCKAAKRVCSACRQLNIFYVDLQNAPTSTEASGQSTKADTLLILHGFPTSSADFHGAFLEALQPKFRRIITLDYPGKALSIQIVLALR